VVTVRVEGRPLGAAQGTTLAVGEAPSAVTPSAGSRAATARGATAEREVWGAAGPPERAALFLRARLRPNPPGTAK
jgi:hypothetical protein